ncbi:hypothetical protein [Haloferula sp. BvORR071]|uniref:hypothetical protein n=1 Tax=Haloferula sp. BvORR071 TaxID=1396141 RepID=UPI002240FF0C|nr:hypothetical protein [Haloferula sp. BvORR071]
MGTPAATQKETPDGNPQLAAKEFERRFSALAAPADIPAALEDAMREWATGEFGAGPPSPEVTKLLYLWMEQDLLAAFRWAGSGKSKLNEEAFTRHGMLAFARFLESKGWRAGLQVMGQSVFDGFYAKLQVARAFGANPDPTAYAELAKLVDGGNRQYFDAAIGSSWPVARLNELLKLATEEKRPGLLTGLGGTMPSADLARWVWRVMGDDTVPEDLRAALRSNQDFMTKILQQRDLSIEERANFLKERMGDSAPEFIAGHDVNDVLNEGRDWRYAFRRGEAGVEEILAVVSKRLPAFAAEDPAELRKHVYFQLVEEDPVKAQELLKGLGEEDRYKLMLEAGSHSLKNIDPDIFLKAMSLVPADSPELWQGRLDAWLSNSSLNYERMGDGYTAWIRGLPAGPDRDMGLYGLATSFSEEGQDDSAKELIDEVKDPKLRELWASATQGGK